MIGVDEDSNKEKRCEHDWKSEWVCLHCSESGIHHSPENLQVEEVHSIDENDWRVW